MSSFTQKIMASLESEMNKEMFQKKVDTHILYPLKCLIIEGLRPILITLVSILLLVIVFQMLIFYQIKELSGKGVTFTDLTHLRNI